MCFQHGGIRTHWCRCCTTFHRQCSMQVFWAWPNSYLGHQKFAVELSPFIAALFNASMSGGYFPASQKIASITPILKKASLDPLDLGNYRPISNLNFLSKLLERTAYKQIVGYMECHHLLPPLQSAYQRHRSQRRRQSKWRLTSTEQLTQALSRCSAFSISALLSILSDHMIPSGSTSTPLRHLGFVLRWIDHGLIMFKGLRGSAPAYLADYGRSLWDLLLMVTLLFLVIELTGVWDHLWWRVPAVGMLCLVGLRSSSFGLDTFASTWKHIYWFSVLTTGHAHFEYVLHFVGCDTVTVSPNQIIIIITWQGVRRAFAVVRFNGETSVTMMVTMMVTSGVPQGSMLGPILFIT